MKILTGILFILLIIGCCKSTNSTPEPNIIWNLQVGNNWTYLDSIFTNSEVHVDHMYAHIAKRITIEYQEEEITVSCLTEESIDRDNNKAIISNLYKNEADGLFHYGKLYESSDSTYYDISKNLLFKYPVEVGDNWSFGQYNVECVGKKIDLSTPYGHFTCHVYELSKDEEDITYYCVPYVGIVGMMTKINDNLVYKRLLSDFNLGG